MAYYNKEKTKVRQILEFIRDNEPARAKDICDAVLKKKLMKANEYTKEYSYYPGWSGFRVYLVQWGYYGDKKKAKIKLTSKGYVLTKLGRETLQ